ncbi:phosphopantetheine-binding protein [Streptomyces sp. NPDC058877]|uniref:phosphopantetheine-binding protein n=1 Tax=unclassified Streptomyces TaxID=2593676 RepID=UPI003687F254
MVTPTRVRDEVIAVWSTVLKSAVVPTHVSFFELGGSALAAYRMIRQLSRTFGIELGLRQAYETPTVDGLSAAIVQRLGAPDRPG